MTVTKKIANYVCLYPFKADGVQYFKHDVISSHLYDKMPHWQRYNFITEETFSKYNPEAEGYTPKRAIDSIDEAIKTLFPENDEDMVTGCNIGIYPIFRYY